MSHSQQVAWLLLICLPLLTVTVASFVFLRSKRTLWAWLILQGLGNLLVVAGFVLYVINPASLETYGWVGEAAFASYVMAFLSKLVSHYWQRKVKTAGAPQMGGPL